MVIRESPARSVTEDIRVILGVAQDGLTFAELDAGKRFVNVEPRGGLGGGRSPSGPKSWGNYIDSRAPGQSCAGAAQRLRD